MSGLVTVKSATMRFMSALLVLLAAALPARAQFYFGSPDQGPGFLSSLPLIGSALEQDMPGVANPWSPFVWPPRIDGEVRFRAIGLTMTQGKFWDRAVDFYADLNKDLGIVDQVVTVETMARVQLSRLSLRVHYEAYVRGFVGQWGELDWPPFRLGADVDFFSRNGLRLGADVDGSVNHPVFTYSHPQHAPERISFGRPLTAGVYLAYNPFGTGGLSPSLETRARWPVRQYSRVTEYEIAAGLKTPQTVLGRGALRGGWRYTEIECRERQKELSAKWSGVFAEYVFLY